MADPVGAAAEPVELVERALQRAVARSVAWASLLGGGGYVLLRAFTNLASGGNSARAAALMLSGALGLYLAGRRPRLSAQIQNIVLFAVVSLSVVEAETLLDPAAIGYTIVMLSAGAVAGRRAVLIAFGAIMAVMAGVVFVGDTVFPAPDISSRTALGHLATQAVFFGAVSAIIVVVREQLWEALRSLSERERELQTVSRRLHESDARLAAIARSGFDLIVELDGDGRVTWASPNHLEIVGRQPEELVGVDPTLWLDHAQQASRSDDEVPGRITTFRLQAASGDWRWFDIRTTPLGAVDDGPARQLTVSRDVTEQRAVEEQLRHSQRLEAVGQLAGGIAHDFNNLLTSIGLHLENLRDAVAGQPEARKAVEVVSEASRRAARLTGQLLSFSRRQSLQATSLDAREVIERLEPLLRSSVNRSITIEVSSSGPHSRCRADRAHLENALLNLVFNARDAMPDGGKLLISVADALLDPPSGPDAAAPGPYVCIAVADTGKGMDADVAERAFDPFFTTKGPGRGTGLGLSMVYGFARQSGGHVQLESAPGQGTTVRLYLPHATDDVAS